MIVVAGGEPALRDAVIRTGSEAGVEAVGWDGAGAPEGADGLVDLGLPPRDWPRGAALVEAESNRVRDLSGRVGSECRVARVSVLDAAPDSSAWLQRAQHAAEVAWRDSPQPTVALRAGVLLGDCGLGGLLRGAIDRWWIVPVPAVADSRLEPLLAEDLAHYCVEAVTGDPLQDEVYDLGCGEMVTGSLLVRSLAENLGVRRWVLPLPGWLGPLVAGGLTRPEFPTNALSHWVAALRGGLLPQRMSAWDAFTVRPAELNQAMAAATGKKYALHRNRSERFGEWQAPEKRGVLWTRPGGRRRR